MTLLTVLLILTIVGLIGIIISFIQARKIIKYFNDLIIIFFQKADEEIKKQTKADEIFSSSLDRFKAHFTVLDNAKSDIRSLNRLSNEFRTVLTNNKTTDNKKLESEISKVEKKIETEITKVNESIKIILREVQKK